MRLSALIGAPVDPDPEIAGLTPDSRAVKPGFLFAALPGAVVDGADFIPQAEKAGAAAVLAQPGAQTRLPLVEDEEPRLRLAQMAARFFSRQPAFIAGITGTNGKTSTAVFTAALWNLLGKPAGSLGTLGANSPLFSQELARTTPEPVTLHETLDAMTGAGVERLAMEVSSHALSQFRADGVRFLAAAFTNLTQDHLDYHANVDEYLNAKLRLFSELLSEDGVAVVNMDGEYAAIVSEAASARGLRVLTTGARGEALRLIEATPRPSGLDISVAAPSGTHEIRLPLIGAFQAENALLAAGLVIASGIDEERVLPRLAELPGVPGRMQLAAEIAGAGVYVDYAHTPDAIATALAAIRPHAAGRIIAIIGAGGDRDKTKRPLMGVAAKAGADLVIVTDDNPRTEDPSAIRKDVLAGAVGAEEIGDREEAIARGVAALREGDVLLIAGKGHESGQIVGTKTLPFDDAEIARRWAGEREEIGR